MKRLQGFVLTAQWMVTCTYHLSPPATTSMTGGTRLDVIVHMLMGCHACFAGGHHLLLYCLRAPPFYFTNKTTPVSLMISTGSKTCLLNSMKQNIIA